MREFGQMLLASCESQMEIANRKSRAVSGEWRVEALCQTKVKTKTKAKGKAEAAWQCQRRRSCVFRLFRILPNFVNFGPKQLGIQLG